MRIKYSFVVLAACAILPWHAARAATYFVDAGGGNDENDGSENAPWKTLTKARSSANGGDVVIVAAGDYGSYSERSPAGNTSYIKFKAAAGAKPKLGQITVSYGSLAEANLIFDGFEVNSDASGNMVTLNQVQNFQLLNSEVHAAHWSKGPSAGIDGVDISASRDILVERVKLYELFRGVHVNNSAKVTIRRNFITTKGGTGIQWLGGNSEGVIELNHIRSEPYTRYPQDPMAFKDPHQSIISVRSSSLTIRSNYMHSMGNSSGIMFYESGLAGTETAYRDITIENNALFNTQNPYALRMYNLGNNVVVRNNFIMAHRKNGSCSDGTDADARYRYNGALVVHNVAAGYSGSGLRVYNNILLGMTIVPRGAIESNNIFWSFQAGSGWSAESPSGTSKVYVSTYMGCNNAPMDFENGTFFLKPTNFKYSYTDLPIFLLSTESIGRNFGDANNQPPTTLGSLDSEGFLMDNGVPRSNSVHSVGPYEQVPSPPLPPGNVEATGSKN
ncbi:right-handed parallel beta-helix repeat-containing protein [Biformimicrobium ophioploci]|uniref:Right handed beta helix domain-containing protein n=1 Tax=Biformimicrobium ophioploci TaxID=3036711 RepID=A0ABQ6M0A9_9GAMM|nr:right-handed parallel beta-helix repeat-containing protein [Microbulbifer sp. NKW57]GMG87732.1 hypothetical protein MNKW57_20530 [Microbulbifer sp. NKW57]